MMEQVEQGKVDGLLAWHPDRLARNWVDAGHIVNLLDTWKQAALRFTTFLSSWPQQALSNAP
jgi:DNA invertase Pin-like site-specific DNA recombinase